MSRFIRAGLALFVALTLSACGASHTASRAAFADDSSFAVGRPDVQVVSFTVNVPKSLKANERNLYYPNGDIVWRGDAPGDRHEQIKAIFEASLRNAAPQANGSRPVRVDVQVLRFHAISEKARYIVGGMHDISFRMRFVDLETGVPFGPSKIIDADLNALAGRKAIAADAGGQTQKARITAHLSRVFVEEFTVAGGHENARLGILQTINGI